MFSHVAILSVTINNKKSLEKLAISVIPLLVYSSYLPLFL
jgi:hypothetical protein